MQPTRPAGDLNLSLQAAAVPSNGNGQRAEMHRTHLNLETLS